MEGFMFDYYVGSFLALCGGIALGVTATLYHVFRDRPKCNRILGEKGDHNCVFNKDHEGRCGHFVNYGDEE